MDSTTLAAAGVHPSITWGPNRRRWFAVWQVGARIDSTEGILATLGGVQASFPRLYTYKSSMWIGYRDGAESGIGTFGRISAIATTILTPIRVGPIHGAYPCVFGHGEFAFQYDGAHAQPSPWPVEVRSLDENIAMEGDEIFGVGAPTGLALIDSGGSILSWDTIRGRIPGLFDVTYAGELCVGAADRGGSPCAIVQHPESGDELVLWPGQDSQNPVIAWDGGENYAVVAWSATGQGVRQATFKRNELRPPVVTHGPFGVVPSGRKALGYFFARGKYGNYAPAENTAILPLDAWQDSDGSLPADVDTQIQAALQAVGRGIVSNTAIGAAFPEWAKVLAVFAGRQEGVVWVHEPASRAEADALVAETRQQVDAHKLPHRPVVVILREEMAADPQFVGCADALAPEIYFRSPESTFGGQLVVARRRIDEVCRALSPSPVFLCVQAFDRNRQDWRANPAALEAIQQAANEALTRTQVLGLFWFAYARPGGVLQYPKLEPWHVAQIALTEPPSLPVDPPKPKPPIPPVNGDEMTPADVRRYAASLPDKALFGAQQRFHNEVLPRDRPMDGAIKSAAWTTGDPDFWTGDVVTGGAQSYLMRSLISEAIIACDAGRTPDQAVGDGYDAAIKAYKNGPGKDPQ